MYRSSRRPPSSPPPPLQKKRTVDLIACNCGRVTKGASRREKKYRKLFDCMIFSPSATPINTPPPPPPTLLLLLIRAMEWKYLVRANERRRGFFASQNHTKKEWWFIFILGVWYKFIYIYKLYLHVFLLFRSSSLFFFYITIIFFFAAVSAGFTPCCTKYCRSQCRVQDIFLKPEKPQKWDFYFFFSPPSLRIFVWLFFSYY